jgi:hypothetical protein
VAVAALGDGRGPAEGGAADGVALIRRGACRGPPSRATNATQGALVVCKVGGDGCTLGETYPLGATFPTPLNPIETFTLVGGAAPTGNCTAPMMAPAGTAGVSESRYPSSNVVSIVASLADRLVEADLLQRTARVTIVAGQTTTVTYTNRIAP